MVLFAEGFVDGLVRRDMTSGTVTALNHVTPSNEVASNMIERYVVLLSIKKSPVCLVRRRH